MSATTEIFETWRRPAQVIRRKLDRGVGEEHALIILFAACLLFYVAQWPRIAREAHLGQQAAVEAGTPLAEVPTLQALLGINALRNRSSSLIWRLEISYRSNIPRPSQGFPALQQ